MGLVHPSEGFLEPLEDSSFEEEPPLDIGEEEATNGAVTTSAAAVKAEVKEELASTTANILCDDVNNDSVTGVKQEAGVASSLAATTSATAAAVTAAGPEVKRERTSSPMPETKPDPSVIPSPELKSADITTPLSLPPPPPLPLPSTSAALTQPLNGEKTSLSHYPQPVKTSVALGEPKPTVSEPLTKLEIPKQPPPLNLCDKSAETKLEPEVEDCVQTLISFSQTVNKVKNCFFTYFTFNICINNFIVEIIRALFPFLLLLHPAFIFALLSSLSRLIMAKYPIKIFLLKNTKFLNFALNLSGRFAL